MSKRIEANITCPNCGNQFPFTLFRTIWGEYDENKELVLSDQINVAICPSCKSRTKIEYPFMYVDVKKQFAVWWEPVNDPQIDQDAIGYAKMFGEGNFYHKAPRIKNWEEFKRIVRRYDSGELKANPIKISQQQQEEFTGMMKGMLKDMKKQNKKNSGCLSIFVFIFLLIGIALYGAAKYFL
jgi:hypothetical protein